MKELKLIDYSFYDYLEPFALNFCRFFRIEEDGKVLWESNTEDLVYLTTGQIKLLKEEVTQALKDHNMEKEVLDELWKKLVWDH